MDDFLLNEVLNNSLNKYFALLLKYQLLCYYSVR